MKIETFVGLHKTLCDDARALSQRKGHDYSGEADTLKNLKLAGAAGLCTPDQGVVVRLLDKLSRLAELDKPGAEAHVADERVRDTILDIINYACLHEALRMERKAHHGDTEDTENGEGQEATEDELCGRTG